jgi:hypothetical protein
MAAISARITLSGFGRPKSESSDFTAEVRQDARAIRACLRLSSAPARIRVARGPTVRLSIELNKDFFSSFETPHRQLRNDHRSPLNWLPGPTSTSGRTDRTNPWDPDLSLTSGLISVRPN